MFVPPDEVLATTTAPTHRARQKRDSMAPPKRSLATTDRPLAQTVPIYFGPGRRLFGWYHPPRGPVRTDCAVVMCSPLGDEELYAHNAIRQWADALADSGIPTLRFDYDGTGNSAVGLGGDRVTDWVESIEISAAELRARAGTATVVLAGVRMGGVLAMAAAERVRADGLILFATPTSGLFYAGGEPPLRVHDATLERAAGATSAIAPLDPLARPLTVRQALVVHRDDAPLDKTLPDRLEQFGADVQTELLPGYARMMIAPSESVAPTEVIDGTLLWLTSRYRAVPERADGSQPASRRSRDIVVGGPTMGTVRESAAVFDGHRALFGVLSETISRRPGRNVGIVLANAGAAQGAGPGRLYVELAREWSALGFSVLRLDVGGIGDSAASLPVGDSHSQHDHAVRDLGAAVRWMRERATVDRVVVAGLCAGAQATFRAGLVVNGIDGVVIINPIAFHGGATDASHSPDETDARREVSSTGFVQRCIRLVHAATAAVLLRLGPSIAETEHVERDLDRITARGVDVLLVFSDGDPSVGFLGRRLARELRRLERRRSNFALRVIADADHAFTRRAARAELSSLLTTHLLPGAEHELIARTVRSR